MRHVLSIEAREQPRSEHALLAPGTAGGSLADAVRLPGLAPAALRLEPCAAGVVVTATVPGVRVAGHAVGPGRRRLLRPGERAEAGGALLALLAAGDGSTRAAAAALLGGGLAAGPSLLVLTGPLAGARVPLRAAVVLGRGRRTGLRLPDALVSRRHARVRPVDGCVEVEDLASRNGLRVNGVRVERRPVPLAHGDVLSLGETDVGFEDPDWASIPIQEARSRGTPGAARGRGRITAAAALLALSAGALLAAALG